MPVLEALNFQYQCRYGIDTAKYIMVKIVADI